MDRSTKVSLVANVSNYVAGMEAASRKTRELGSDAEKLAAKKDAINELGTGLLAIGAVAAVGVGLAVKAFADFDQKLSNIQAATNESADNMDLLRAAAIQAGKDTAFSAGEAADAITELAKAGVSTADVLGGGLAGALSLAAAGEIDVARAAEIAATALTQFKLSGEDIPRVADLLASGANNAQGGVEDLSNALSQGGLVAAATGLSIEETVGTLSAFASAGLLGSDAGTSFKSMLQRLTPVSAESRKEMERLGISAYDAEGGFIGIEAFAGNLQMALKDLTPEQRNASQAIIFGADAVRASNILYEQGASGIGKWIKTVDDSGAAARTAAIKLDNLNGDLQILGGSFETALIQSGSGANDVLRSLVQSATGLLNLVADLPGPVLSTGLALGAVVAAAGLVGGTALLGVPKVAAFKLALDTLGVSGRRAALGIGLATVAATGAVLALGFFISKQAEASATAQELGDSLDDATGAFTDYTRELIAKKLAESGAFEAAKEAGVSQRELTDAVIEGGDALEEIKAKLVDNNTVGTFFTGVGIRAGNATTTINELSAGLDKSQSNFRDQAAAAAESESATESVTDVFSEASASSVEYAEGLTEIVDALKDYGSAAFDVEASTDSFYGSLDDLTAILAEGTGSLDQTTEAGRSTSSALLDTAKSTNDYAAAVLNAGGSTEEVQGILEAGRQKIIETRIALGDSEEAARAYADQLVSTPDQVATAVQLNGVDEARAQISRFIRDNDGRVINMTAVLTQRAVTGDGSAGGYASGGAIRGPGTGTSDQIPIMASNGEHIWTAAEVRAAGGHRAVEALRDEILAGRRKYATGGAIRYSPAPVPAPSYAAAPGSGGGGNVSVTQKIYPSKGMSEMEIARISERNINFTLRGAS